jgi:hypothetical protein
MPRAGNGTTRGTAAVSGTAAGGAAVSGHGSRLRRDGANRDGATLRRGSASRDGGTSRRGCSALPQRLGRLDAQRAARRPRAGEHAHCGHDE